MNASLISMNSIDRSSMNLNPFQNSSTSNSQSVVLFQQALSTSPGEHWMLAHKYQAYLLLGREQFLLLRDPPSCRNKTKAYSSSNFASSLPTGLFQLYLQPFYQFCTGSRTHITSKSSALHMWRNSNNTSPTLGYTTSI